ncbi:MAG: hypothetical protein ACK5ZA_00860 [Betaproteobacteria bacterium]
MKIYYTQNFNSEKVSKAATMFYNHPETSSIKNTKKLWATSSCGHNIVDYIRQLADVTNIQQAVSDGLTPMTREKDRKAWLEHGETLYQFLNQYRNLP